MYSSARRILASQKFWFPLCVAGGAFLSSSRSHTIFAFAYPSTKDIIRGEYENKIRRDSPPEKIFEVFATEKEGDNIFMTHEDFFRSICPFAYSTKEQPEEEGGDDKKDDGDKDKKDDGKEDEKKGFQSKALQEFADVDKDGKLSIYEYHLVTSLIQIERSKCTQFFKERNIQTANKDILVQFFDFLKKSSKVKLTMASGVFDPRKFSMSQEEYTKLIDGLIDNLLDGKDSIPASKIVQIREDILKDIYKFQFDAFEQNDKGQITGEDFAKNLISYMEPKKAKQYFRHLEGKNFEGEITFEEFYLFQKFLLDNVEVINSKIEEKGFTNRKSLKKLIEEYQKKLGLQVNLNQIDIFIKVLDANGNNRIEPDEFKALVEERSSFGGGEDTSLSKPLNELKQVALRAISKAERIWEIINE